jgi:metal-responsive CopG/Arc/MetJ family transcriptional regulator
MYPVGMNELQKDVQVSVKIPVDLADRLAKVAQREDRSVSSTIRVALRAYLGDEGASAEAA